MTAIQLRRYEIHEGAMENFLAWWETLVPVREHFGFRVVFAFVDESTNQFVWAVAHDADFDEAEKTYIDSPERAAVRANQPQVVGDQFIAKVKVIREP